jgi:hypothetical protein
MIEEEPLIVLERILGRTPNVSILNHFLCNENLSYSVIDVMKILGLISESETDLIIKNLSREKILTPVMETIPKKYVFIRNLNAKTTALYSYYRAVLEENLDMMERESRFTADGMEKKE